MIAARQNRLAQVGPFVLAFGLAIPLAILAGRVAPIRHSSIEIGNAFVATVGMSWALVQLVANHRSEILRRAWALGALSCLLILAEDHLEPWLVSAAPRLVETGLSAALWISAAAALLACGRAFATRRFVMVAMRSAAAVAVAAAGLNLALGLSGAGEGRHGLGKVEDVAELIASLMFLAGLVLARIAPMKAYVFKPEEIGRRARALFYDLGLETRRRYPTPFPILAAPVFRHVLTLAIALYYLPRAAGAVRRATGRGAIRQFADLMWVGYVHGIDGKSYYVHDLYRDPALVAGTMTRVETKNGLNKALQDLRAHRPGVRDMNDKLEFWRACEANGVPSAPILATVEDGAVVRLDAREAFDRDLFVKERKGRGGRLTRNFERIGPQLYRDDAGAIVNLDEVLRDLQALSEGRRLIVQPKLKNHPAIASLADKALVVFRVMTCLDLRGDPHVTHGVLRLLRRFEPDWTKTADADWGCAIDVATGEFGLMTGDAPETCTLWFADHPMTGERVAGRVLEGWPEIAEAALAAHRVFSARTLVGWDIGWTEAGPVILEGNSNPDFSYFQRVARTPVGRSPLGPLLNAHLDMLTAKLLAQRAG
ncbi:hypothetical protein IHQ68_18420 [Chelatococcus sambhunathii]|uniref:Alpha-L-glutamate ligase-related protein ATP-grasp domain-containing protein n=1 Tax=Chelatococcus sambhunathii TaxID=363953 RepID=A0ABU1DL44_9HYPH|nr:sugar-transfer associated ATP-grasp domain-containing protein [Chelatococcus sambhunathii]MDR4308600.1 hypothetical protein [Chelatococcus sambhunathii]